MKTTFFDRVNIFLQKTCYRIGNLRAKIFVGKIGKQILIHPSVKFFYPSRVSIADGCEIRNGSCLDARSEQAYAISMGKGCSIKEYVSLTTYMGSIKLGDGVLIGRGCTLFGHGGITIGSNSMVSPHTLLVASNHGFSLNGLPFKEQGTTREPIIIGANVWIGGNCTILGGAEIADNIVIAAGTVVGAIKLDSGFLYAGVPVKKIRHLTGDELSGKKLYQKSWNAYELLR